MTMLILFVTAAATSIISRRSTNPTHKKRFKQISNLIAVLGIALGAKIAIDLRNRFVERAKGSLESHKIDEKIIHEANASYEYSTGKSQVGASNDAHHVMIIGPSAKVLYESISEVKTQKINDGSLKVQLKRGQHVLCYFYSEQNTNKYECEIYFDNAGAAKSPQKWLDLTKGSKNN